MEEEEGSEVEVKIWRVSRRAGREIWKVGGEEGEGVGSVSLMLSLSLSGLGLRLEASLYVYVVNRLFDRNTNAGFVRDRGGGISEEGADLPSITLVSSALNRRPSGEIRTVTLFENAIHLNKRYNWRADEEVALHRGASA